uniref:Uncharacterized protein n=1 Tax=Magallana gigas TaxID=29159 RepID=K1PWH5_MAGGI
MPDIHVKESYVDLSNQEDICNYYEIVQDDDRREIYQEQKKDVVARHRIHHLRNLQTYEKSDQRYVSKNARSAFKSINKSSDKLKEETYIQNVETGRQHTFVENDKSEMVDRENPEVWVLVIYITWQF